MSEFKKQLLDLGIDINENQMNQLKKYYELLIEWNQKINLTTITEKEQVYLKHFYDSATIVKIIDLNKVDTLCDIGTGAGFPGLVLKILFPNLKITLVDSLNKRINFLNLVIKELNLKDIETIPSRIEDYAKTNQEKYDVVTSRAVAHLSILLEYSISMVKVGKYFIAMKANINNELNESKQALNILNCKINKIEEFSLPNNEGYRTLINIKKENKTNSKYPRKYNEIKKKRL